MATVSLLRLNVWALKVSALIPANLGDESNLPCEKEEC